MKTQLSIWRTALRFTFFCLAVPALATSLQLVTTIDPSVGAPASGGGNSMNPIITPDGRYVLFASTANNLALTGSNTPFLAQSPPKINVFLRDRTNGTTTLVSVNLAGTGGGNGDSLPIELSTNGQYALFESTASDLVPGDTNNATDVFVRDLVHGTNILVSVSTNGSCANGVSWESAMTPDGRYVAFASAASNLVPGDTNGIRDIFIRDLQTGVTTLASPGATGPGGSDAPQITPDGRYVAFLSTATNLVPGVITAGEVYVRDLTGAATYLASTNAHAAFTNIPVPIISFNHAISDNGRYVAFESSINGSSSGGIIQRYDLQTGFTGMVYTNAVAGPIGYPLIRNLDMTPDGRFIAFVANTNSGSGVFLWDAQTATTTLVSGDSFYHTVPAGSVCDWPVVDPSGRFVVFLSTAVGLTTNDVAGDFHMYLRDVLAGTTTLLDADMNGFGFPKDFMSPARLTPDGRYVTFDCSDEYPATNIYNQPYNTANRSLVSNDNNRAYDVFVRDLTTNTIELISARQPALPSQSPSDSSTAPIFSVDTAGRYIAFASAADSLVPNYTNKYCGVFVHDLLTGTNLLVSVDADGFANAGGMSTDPSISGDGRYVAFTSYATNLVADDINKAQDVFVRDLQTGTTTLVSVDADFIINNDSYSPVISADGRYVLFRSVARIVNITGTVSSSGDNLYLQDLQTGLTYALTATSIGGGNIPMRNPVSMTPDGHFVAFYGSTPYDDTSEFNSYLYVWDSQAAALIYTNDSTGSITNLAISPDGNRIVYSTITGFYATDRAANTNWQISASVSGSHAWLQFSGDSRFLVYSTTDAQVGFDINGVADVYLYDFVTSSNFLVSQSNPPGAANGPSDSPVISNDGRFVAYRSTATNLVAGATNGLPNVFLYDRQTGTTTLLSANASGMGGNNRSFAPQFSGDGQTVVFQSWASDLISQDFNQVNDLVAVNIDTLISMPATIAYPPTDKTVFVGWTATLAVTAWGTPPLSYQWSFNGTNISGATNTSLTLNNVQLSQAGNYAVLVTNLYGSILSSNAMLTVLAMPPSISIQPANQTAFVAWNETFSVTVSGSPPLSYQWFFNGASIAGATNASLKLSNLQPAQAGNYAVLVTNAFGSILSSNAMLMVNPCAPPSGLVSWWPGEGNANDIVGTNNGTLVNSAGFAAGEVGQAFSFDGSSSYVSIPDSPSLDSFTTNITIELWLKSNQLSSDWMGIVTKGNSSWQLQATPGANTVNFSVSVGAGALSGSRNVNDDQWHHVAAVYDGANMFLYVDGTLDVSQPATGLIPQNNDPLCIGANAQAFVLSCFCNEPGYFFNGLIDEVSIYNRALTASEIQVIYAMASEGKCPPAPPSIITQPTNQTVITGGTANFSITVSGAAPLSYQWQFNGTTIPGATGSCYTLTNVQPNQAGIYSVVVSNALGSVASLYSVLRVWTSSSVVAWGDDDAGQTDVPAGLTNAVAVAAGASHSLALKADGTVVAWGDSWYGETEVPSDLTNGVAIAAGDSFSLALRSDGTVVGWGFDDDGEIDVPVDLTNVVAIAAGDSFSLALKADGTVVAWGEDSYGQTNVPSDLTNVVAVAGGWYHSLALKTDGTVVAWGDDSYGQTHVPMDLTNGVAVAAGAVHSLALKTDGTVAAWGHEWGAIPMDLTNGVAIAGGVFHSLALRADSTVAAWGYNWHSYGETNVPSGLTNVVAIAAGGFHNLALAGNQPPLIFPPDHFAWNPIPSPRFVNTPFGVTLRAQNPTNGLFTNFIGTAILGTTNGVAVSPLVSGSFVQGVWTGSVVISQTASNLVLRADDGLGHFGLANPINVISLPSLGMVRSGNFALFMWPAGYSGFVLENSGSLSPATWALIPYAPFQLGDQYLIPLEMTGTNGFYRLRFPGP